MLGRTVGLPANGAVSNIAISPSAVFRLRDELRGGGYDVVHVHEPIVPAIGWDAVGVARAPLVGTFHTYSTNRLTNNLGNLAGAAGASTACTCGSPSRRPPRGRGSASSAAATA